MKNKLRRSRLAHSRVVTPHHILPTAQLRPVLTYEYNFSSQAIVRLPMPPW